MENLVEKIELHDTLNPKLWDPDNKLDSEVSEKLHEIVDQFILELEENDIPIKVLDAHLVGSNASFNYTDESDLDVHVVANFEDVTCDPIILNLLYNFFKKYFNDKYEISIHGVPVELYVEDVNAATISNGIYSLFNDEWIKFPEPVEVPDIDITGDLEPYEDRYDEIMEERDADKAEELISELYLLRKNALATEGEYSVGNLVFKEFRKLGYLDGLKQLTVDERAKELSLESLNEEQENNNVKEIKDYIKNNFNIATYFLGGPLYILTDGRYLNLGSDGSHFGLDDNLYQNGILEQDPFDYSYLYPNTIMVDLFNAIRCSSGENLGDSDYSNPYVQLPKKLPTSAQFESLGDWIDNLGYGHKLFVDGVEYDLSKVSSEYIIKRIKRYYSSGQLYESSNPEIFYRITVINPDGKEAGLFRGLNKLLKRLWDNDDEIYDEINYPLSELEELTHYPENFNNKRAIFAYKEDKFNQIKDTLLELEYVLNALHWEVKITKIRRPGKVVYEDEDQIAYDPKTTSVVEWLNESKEDNQKLIDHLYAENCFADVMDQDTGELLPAKVIWSVRNFPINESLITEDSENIGYHYGDLGKADYKHQFSNRNTGGFGTGIYFVGTPISQRKDAMGYKERPEHVIDLSKYNLYKPKDNNQAYKLHDALLYLNNYGAATNEVPATWDDILDEYEEVFDEVFLELNSSAGNKPVKLNTAPILRYIRKYIEYYPYKITDVDYDSLRDIAKEIEERRVEESQKFYNAIDNLYSALNYSVGEDRLIKAVKSAIKDTSDIAPATLIMQKLGYDGIDVRHLNKDDQGLQGLDNFGFGSVLYDLKESVEETGRTVIKAVVFHNEDQPKKQVPNFQDFEEDGLYRLGENDYIVFEKRWEEDPRGWGMIHAEVIDDFVIPVFSDYRDKYIEEAGLEIDNLQPNSDLYHDLRKLNTKTFSKYTNIIKRAVDKYFK